MAVVVEGNSSDNALYTVRGLQPLDNVLTDNAAASASASAAPPAEDGKKVKGFHMHAVKLPNVGKSKMFLFLFLIDAIQGWFQSKATNPLPLFSSFPTNYLQILMNLRAIS